MKVGWGSLVVGIIVGWLLSGLLSRTVSKATA